MWPFAISDSPLQLSRSIAGALTSVDADLAFSFRPLADQIDAALIQERLVAMLAGFFGGLALVRRLGFAWRSFLRPAG